jgi:two-component system, NarL family, nitrate/nitrite response regulator NarL
MARAAEDSGTITVGVVDDHPIFRAGLRLLLASKPGVSVICEGSDGLDVPSMVREQRPDVLLVDLCMPEADGLEALRLLRNLAHTTRPVILATCISSRQMLEALQLGAVGVLLKSSTTELLLRCIHAVAAGEYWVDRQGAADLIGALRLQSLAEGAAAGAGLPLSAIERRIVAALRTGASNKLIARELGVAEQTVKNRLSQLYTRFSASNRLDLIVRLTRNGLLWE